MSTVAECLKNLTKLADINTGLLQALNESFTTKNNYIGTEIGGIKYNIPSFISLENKINRLQENFENLVHSPETGEAFFNINGNSRAIVVRGYENAPAPFDLNDVKNFDYEDNNIFKDFLTPVPYINFNITGVSGDITSFVVKKIIPKSQAMIDFFKEELKESTSVQKSYIDIKQLQEYYANGVDYIEYDKIIKTNIKGDFKDGRYVIEKILEDYVDDNLDNYITIRIRTDVEGFNNKLEYIGQDLLPISLKKGDILTTWDNSAKLEVAETPTLSNVVKVVVVNGEYLNLVECSEGNSIDDLSKLRYLNNLSQDSNIKIPLEEDQYVYVTIAPYKETMNIRANWGTGLIINTYNLTNTNGRFEEYYKNNVKNIGDTLYELTSLFSQDYITKLTKTEIEEKIQFKPVINENHLQVIHINKHLNDTTTVKTIKSLYNDKKLNESKLNEIQNKILEINNNLSSISYDDTTGIRTVYEQQLREYTSQKNEIITSITKNIEAISNAALNAEIPLESAKYRIRGFYDLTNHEDVIGVKVQYRYKNTESTHSGASIIGDNFLFGDWVEIKPFMRDKVYSDNGFTWEPVKDSVDEPSCNQIEIPISQGEIVELRVKFIYKYNYPLARVESAWSDSVNVKFPEQFLKDIQVTTILDENNNDIETNRFQNILHDNGIYNHVNDKLTDQDLTYFHKPESIASGFYTAERRIIPLKDKLMDLDNMIKLLQNTIDETNGQLEVSIKIGDNKWSITEGQYNEVTVANYSQFEGVFPENDEANKVVGNYILDKNKKIITNPKISIKNNSSKYVRLYSVFPGPRNVVIGDLVNTKYKKSDYDVVDQDGNNTSGAIYYKIPEVGIEKGTSTETNVTSGKINNIDVELFGWNSRYKAWLKPQTANQFLTFRLKNPYDNTSYYVQLDSAYTTNDQLSSNIRHVTFGGTTTEMGATLYPSLNNHNDLCLDDDNKYGYKLIAPGQEILIPLEFIYRLDASGQPSISKTMSFDLRTSLYEDLKNYTFRITANYHPSSQEINSNSNKEVFSGTESAYRTTI